MATLQKQLKRYINGCKKPKPSFLTLEQKQELGLIISDYWRNNKPVDRFWMVQKIKEIDEDIVYMVNSYPNWFKPKVYEMVIDYYNNLKTKTRVRKRIQASPIYSGKKIS